MGLPPGLERCKHGLALQHPCKTMDSIAHSRSRKLLRDIAKEEVGVDLQAALAPLHATTSLSGRVLLFSKLLRRYQQAW